MLLSLPSWAMLSTYHKPLSLQRNLAIKSIPIRSELLFWISVWRLVCISVYIVFNCAHWFSSTVQGMPSVFINHKPFCTAVFSILAFLGLVELVTTASCVVMYSSHACTRVVLQLTFPVYVRTHTRVICFEFHCVACSFTCPTYMYFIMLICSYVLWECHVLCCAYYQSEVAYV